jgi:hypothetical protein
VAAPAAITPFRKRRLPAPSAILEPIPIPLKR